MFNMPLDANELARRLYKELELMQYDDLEFDYIEICRNTIYLDFGNETYKIEVTREK
jgi:hypothetical protein